MYHVVVYSRLIRRITTNAAESTATEVSVTTTNKVIMEEPPELVNQGYKVNIFSEINLRETFFTRNSFTHTNL